MIFLCVIPNIVRRPHVAPETALIIHWSRLIVLVFYSFPFMSFGGIMKHEARCRRVHDNEYRFLAFLAVCRQGMYWLSPVLCSVEHRMVLPMCFVLELWQVDICGGTWLCLILADPLQSYRD